VEKCASEALAASDCHSVTRALEFLDAGRVDLARAELAQLLERTRPGGSTRTDKEGNEHE
jgi:hypothetical protein